jgi:hypothetical protein
MTVEVGGGKSRKGSLFGVSIPPSTSGVLPALIQALSDAAVELEGTGNPVDYQWAVHIRSDLRGLRLLLLSDRHLVGLAATNEALELGAFDTPAHLPAEQHAAQLSGLQPPAHGLGVDLELRGDLLEGQEALGGHGGHNGISVAPRRDV